jgi:NAD(P)-dependent dehydrogenase (short-subunit alcohol dehydrogenase family)
MGSDTVLITGTSTGIGRATAEAFLDAGWTVYATARDTDDVADLAEAGCETLELDVTDDEQIRAVVEQVVDETGRIDCLVNNAGYGQFGPLEDVPMETVHEQFEVNVYGPHRLTRAVLPHMRDQQSGTIVNLSSVAGRVSTPGMGVYCGSKFALEGMSDALRSEVQEYGIDVVLVQPGPVDTNFADNAAEKLDGKLERSGVYGDLYSFYEEQQIFGGASALASRADAVAAVILEAACSPDPEPRYPVGQVARVSLLARFAPDRIRDAVFRLAGKLV